MKKKGTRFFSPESINDLGLIVDKENVITLVGGGSSLFRKNNGEKLVIPGAIIILDNIQELKKENRTERYFEFGSMLTIEEIITSSRKNIPKVLLKGLQSIAPFPIRNIATLGGTIANTDIISDIVPLLLIFNCKVEVIYFNDSKYKAKWESIKQYLSKKDSRGLHLLTRIRIPLISPTYSQYYKTGFKYNLFNEISFSGITEIEKDNITFLSMAFNIENRLIIRTKDIEANLIGKRLPKNHNIRDTFIKSIHTSLSSNKDLKEDQIYRMSQIILNFLEGF